MSSGAELISSSSAMGAASFFSIGEDPCSSLISPQKEASNISSLLKVIIGAMHCRSSLTVLQGMPAVVPEASLHNWSAWAIASVLYHLKTQKSWKSEADPEGTKFFWLGSIGGASHHPEVSCWAAGSLKAATCHSTKCWASWSLYSSWITLNCMLIFPHALISIHQMGKG